MDDLISRQAAIYALEWKWAGKAAINAIKNLQSIDAQEIVRCKNCKYNPDNSRPFYDDDPVETYAWCKTEYFDEQGFCSCAKLAINLR